MTRTVGRGATADGRNKHRAEPRHPTAPLRAIRLGARDQGVPPVHTFRPPEGVHFAPVLQHSFLLVQRPPSGVQVELGGVTHAHWLKSNCWPVGQAAWHVPPQRIGKSASHWHPPFTQSAFAGHSLPQKPQLLTSLATHMLSQKRGVSAEHAHDAPAPLFTHTWPPAQHVPKHLTSPSAHGSA
jgi:hypothetical protein